MIIEPPTSGSLTRRRGRFPQDVSVFVIAFVLAFTPLTGHAQVGEGRQAMAEGDHLRAVEILTRALGAGPTPDTYLYLGLAHANLKQYGRALNLFTEASQRYPDDPRFLNETAGVHLANKDVDLARDALREALRIAPRNEYAADLLASLDLAEGAVEEALDLWNEVGQPRIDEIFQNFSPGFLNWEIPTALTFGSGDILEFEKWKTTETRLFRTNLFSNVALELEPSPEPDMYNAIVRTSPRTNTRTDILFDLFRGLPVETAYLELWDLGQSGVSWRSSYRWDEDRRRVRGQLLIPLPIPGLPVLNISNTWRSEQWDLATALRDEFSSDSRFDYKANAVRVGLEVVPDHRFEIDASLEYRNRAARGQFEALAMDSRNSGTFRIESRVRTVEGRYSNQLRFEGFVARSSILGDLDFSGGSVQIANRYTWDEASDTSFNFSVTGGTSRGDVPVDSYFLLGIGRGSAYPLRGHVASNEGRYGRAPMGTDFVLINTDLERRLVTVPLFNTLGIPYLVVKAMGFFDSAKVFDRNRIFRQGQWLNDLGAGLRFETPTGAFTVLYGRDVTDGVNNLYGYVERRFW
jgi:hypothetical protein